jgi:CRP/FNR family transcriptional regulator, cyclic AMP receptor protein
MDLFGADQILLLRAVGHPASWSRGSVLMTEGENSAGVLLIERGQVKVTVSSRSGYTTLLAIRGPGELIGELSALDGQRRSGTVTALSEVHATVIPAPSFRSLLEGHGELALAVLKLFVGRLRESDRRRAEFGGHDSRTRVVYVLVEMAERYGAAVSESGPAKVVTVTQQELANASGTSRESVVRSLRELHRDGLVETRRGKVIVLDPKSLADSVQG